MNLFPKPPSILQTINELDNWPNFVRDEFEQRAINVKWFGAKGDGVTDDTAAIKTAIQEATNERLPLWFPPPGPYCFSEELVIPVDKIALYGNKTILKFTPTTGIAITLTSAEDTQDAIRNVTASDSLSGFVLSGPGKSSSTVGLRIGSDISTGFHYLGSFSSVRNLDIHSFGNALRFDNHTWNNHFNNVSIDDCGVAIKCNGTVNVGENIVFSHCRIYHVDTAIENLNSKAFIPVFIACSFNYLTGDYLVYAPAGTLTFIGSRVETAKGLIKGVNLIWVGGSITLDAGLETWQFPDDTQPFIEAISPVSGMPVTGIAFDRVRLFLGQDWRYDFVSNTSDYPTIRKLSLNTCSTRNSYRITSSWLNYLSNGGFELGNLDGWTVVSGNPTIVSDVKRSGSYSVLFDNDTYQNEKQSISIQVPVEPGDLVNVSLYYKLQNIVQGSVDWKKFDILLRWITDTNQEKNAGEVYFDGTTDWTKWTNWEKDAFVPYGVRYFKIEIGTQFAESGKAWVDDVIINVIK